MKGIFQALAIAAMMVLIFAASTAQAHDMHGLTHDHMSGAWMLLAWAVAAGALYVVELATKD